MADPAGVISGSTTAAPAAKPGFGSFLDKFKPKAGDAASPSVAPIPVNRVVSSPKRTLGRGTRDTILNGGGGVY